MLWTHDVLSAARAIYEKAGFKIIATASFKAGVETDDLAVLGVDVEPL
jgi:hypothetical protein